MVECNCGDYAKPIDGPYHAHHCAVTQFEAALHEAEEPFYVRVPEHEVRGFDRQTKLIPWPTRLLAEGAMHRVIGGYPNTPVLLYRGDIVIDMKIREDPTQFEWRRKNGKLYDIQSGHPILQEAA